MEKIYGVIGDPIAHSLSPDIHNDAFRQAGIEARYFPLRVTAEDLADAVKGMKAIGVSGFNVTIPHKAAVIPLLDEIDPLAAAIGAVNTVVYKNGRYIGYNTDGRGFYDALTAKAGDIRKKKILIIGAGGAARAVYFTLVRQGAVQTDLANRTPARAEALIADCPFPNRSAALPLHAAEEKIGEYDIIIQTTSSGMSPFEEDCPLSLNRVKAGAFVSDIIYNPLETKLLRQAGEQGAGVQNGLDMFVNQAALAFEIWTGQKPDTVRMKEIVLNKLGGNTC